MCPLYVAGVWDAAPLEAELLVQTDRLGGGKDAVLVIDDTSMPKKGDRSVGVAAQYASTLGTFISTSMSNIDQTFCETARTLATSSPAYDTYPVTESSERSRFNPWRSVYGALHSRTKSCPLPQGLG
jgi:DDE superfamily endonuclease